MDYKIEDFVDISLLQDMQEKLNVIYSFPSAIIANDGKILTSVAWQDICTKFHRTNSQCEKECIKSNQYIFEHIHEANPTVSYQCPHGLVENATPIIIDGKHLGNFFTGQFFLDKPDKEFFKKQAKIYGFDEKAYLEALDKVPIWTKEKHAKYLDFIKGFIEIIASIGLNNLKERKIKNILKEKEQSNIYILKTAMDGFLLVDMQGRLLEVNEAYCRMSGFVEAELLSMNINILEAGETDRSIKQHIQKIITYGEDRFITRHRRNDGSIFDVEVSVQYQKDFERFVVFLRDITENRQTEEELIKAKEKAEESEKYLRKIIDHSPLPMVISLDNKYVEFVNRKFTQLYGYTQNDISTAEKWFQKAYPDKEYREKVMNTWEQSIIQAVENNTDVEPQLYNMRTKDGSNRDCEFFMVLMGNRAVIVANDITERKKFEDELIIAKEKAEESDRLKTAFLQNMSHEIRTPMNAIMGFSELLVQNYNNKIKLEKFSQIINQRCNDLLEIISDILEIAKIESGQLQINVEQCNLNDLFSELSTFFNEYQKRIGKTQINFRMYPLDEPIGNLIITDKVKLKQIFINLIGNAFKFTEKGHIIVGCSIENEHNITFYVSDTGIGIPKDKYDQIFERFTQLKHITNHAIGGTGLGLSIVKGLVSLLGGRIWIESELENQSATKTGGTTFYISIPYKTSQLLQTEPIVIDETQEYHFIDKKILVVEDDIYNADFIKEILSDTGLMIIHTEFGKEAIQIASTQLIDLVLMDIQLPDINGYEVVREIKKSNPGIKIIAQTAYAAFEEKQKALDAGCIDYISKPIKSKLLLSTIGKYIYTG